MAFMSNSTTHYPMCFWHDEHIRKAVSSYMKTLMPSKGGNTSF